MSIPTEAKTPKDPRNAKPVSTGGSLGLQLRTYRTLIHAIRTEPLSSKPKRIAAALQALQHFMTDDFMCVYQDEVHDSVDDMKRLIGDVPLQDHLAKECFSFANAVIAYGKRFGGKQKQTEWQRYSHEQHHGGSQLTRRPLFLPFEGLPIACSSWWMTTASLPSRRQLQWSPRRQRTSSGDWRQRYLMWSNGKTASSLWINWTSCSRW
jgi:hypothetical protein